MTSMKTWKNETGADLPPGPWDAEPDKAQWVDEATGLDCLVHRNHFGALCGYVGVPPNHPWHGVDYGAIPLERQPHGGLTFSNFCQESEDEAMGICHIPEPGRPDGVWWLGFDCGHAFDLSPGFNARLLLVDPEWANDAAAIEASQTYRTFEYVQAEVRALAKQVVQAATPQAASP